MGPEERGAEVVQEPGYDAEVTLDDVSALWGWTLPNPPHDAVPYEERCWRCDTRRIHDGCQAGLCDRCCEQLRAASAA